MVKYGNGMMNPKAIIFDLDGTLIHSAPDLHAAANAMLDTLERPALDLPTVISFIGNGVEKLVERSLDATGGSDALLRRSALEMFLTFYQKNMTTLTRPYPGVISTLQAFKDAGIPLGICTNKPTQPARDICDRLDLTRFFQVILGAEIGQPKKPDPAPLLACLKELAVQPSEAIYIGDSAIDFLTARNANVPFRLFSKGYLNAPLPDLSVADSFDDWAFNGIATL
jgi:phosphoglycolate phosphatase